jgi:hypothetical protein
MSQTEVEINDLRKRLLAAEERLALVEENYGHRVDTFIRDTEHLLGRVEKLERQIVEGLNCVSRF